MDAWREQIETELAARRRDARGGVLRTGLARPAPPLRTARISTVVDSSGASSGDPVWHVYGIKFDDASFEEAATIQTATVAERDATEYFAGCSPLLSFDAGEIVLVSFLNGRWWIAGGGGANKIVTGKPDADIAQGAAGTVSIFDGAAAGSFTDTGENVSAYARIGAVSAGDWVYLAKLKSGWEIVAAGSESSLAVSIEIGTSLHLFGGDAEGHTEGTLDFDVAGTTIAAVATDWPGGIVIPGASYELLRVGEDYFVLHPAVTLLAKANADYARGDIGQFHVYSSPTTDTGILLYADVRVNATIESGDWVVLSLVDGPWADFGTEKGHWTAVKGGGGPAQASLTAVADGFCAAGATALFASGAYSAAVPFGVVLAGVTYELAWVDSGYVVQDPEIALLGKPAALVTAGNAATVTIYSGATGGETSLGQTVSGWVREGLVFSGQWALLAWVDDGWEVVNPALAIDGTADAAIADGASGTVSVLAETTDGDNTDSGTNVTAFSRFGAVGSGKAVSCVWHRDTRTWRIQMAHC